MICDSHRKPYQGRRHRGQTTVATFVAALMCSAFTLTVHANVLPIWSTGWKPQFAAISTRSGHFLQADGTGAVVTGPVDGFGAWETFQLFNETHTDGVLRYGDMVVIGAHTGRFLNKTASGSIQATATSLAGATHFVVTWPTGEAHDNGEVVRSNAFVDFFESQGPLVSETASEQTGRTAFLGRCNGIGCLAPHTDGSTAIERSPREPGAFRIALFQPDNVQLRSPEDRLASAEGGGGGIVSVNRRQAGMWENFRLVNLSRQQGAIQVGDRIAFQSISGKFLAVASGDGAEIQASSNRISANAQFLVRAVDDVVAAGHQRKSVLLAPISATNNIIRAEGDRLVSRSITCQLTGTLARCPRLQIVPSIDAAADYGFVPDGSTLGASRPFATAPVRRTSSIAAVAVGFDNLIALNQHSPGDRPFSLTGTQVKAGVMASTGNASIKRYVDANTGGAIQVEWGAFVGPLAIRAGSSNAEIWETIGNRLSPFATNRRVDSSQTMVLRLDYGDAGGQYQPGTNLTNSAGYSICCSWLVAAVNEDFAGGWGTVRHETSHFLWGQGDLYGFPEPLHGDAAAWPQAGVTNAWEAPSGVPDISQFIVEVVGGGTLAMDSVVRLRAATIASPQYLRVMLNFFPAGAGNRHAVNLDSAGTSFRIVAARRGDSLRSGVRIQLASDSGKLYVPYGAYGPLLPGFPTVPREKWATFRLDVRPGDPIASGARVALVTDAGEGDLVTAQPNARSRPDAAAVTRGLVWDGQQGRGVGGIFDNADYNSGTNLVNAWDRIRNGWAQYRYLTPTDRGCYAMAPFLAERQTMILYDQLRPNEYYVAERRIGTPQVDEVPDGFVVDWVAEPGSDYWRDYAAKLPGSGPLVPAMISASATGVAANVLARPLTFGPNDHLGLGAASAVFGDPAKRVTLPLGDGSPSRFVVSFRNTSDHGELCIH